MFEGLQKFASQKAYQLIRKKGVSCPDCGQALTLPAVMPMGGLQARMACIRCEWQGSLIDVMKSGSQQVSPLEVKPAGSRIRSSDYRWVIPGTGRVNGELVFGTLWLLFCAAFVGMALFAGKGASFNGGLIFVTFMIPFSSVGFW
ncbi:MAG: hypothetical protein P1U90_11980, partial [Akkermansiaceae bacterium]|nr:hypothetical protein [Akkermansiaceae bacterium]